jgi:predicted short-subunit dehydrogenase-like oxidoreductase (DUF2520 family)
MAGIHSVSIVGTGNVAHHLGKALRDAGLKITSVYGRNHSAAQELADKLDCARVSSLIELHDDLILLCVSDDAISDLVKEIPDDCRIAYTSGSVPLSALPKKSHFGVFYPLQTFSKHRGINLSKVPFLIEAQSEKFQSELMQLASMISEKVIYANSEDRLHYHISAVFVNNFVNHLLALGKAHSDEHGLDWEVLKPLIHETVAKINSLDPMAAQTGPALRNDQDTIHRHMGALSGIPKEVYALITQSIQQSSKK